MNRRVTKSRLGLTTQKLFGLGRKRSEPPGYNPNKRGKTWRVLNFERCFQVSRQITNYFASCRHRSAAEAVNQFSALPRAQIHSFRAYRRHVYSGRLLQSDQRSLRFFGERTPHQMWVCFNTQAYDWSGKFSDMCLFCSLPSSSRQRIFFAWMSTLGRGKIRKLHCC